MNTTNNSELISIIVPVYNVESFLEHCITSILSQTYENFEMILVDDGSTDSSGMICDEWAKKDSRISVIHQANGGLSAARNSGIDVAKGKYLCFIDSDDFVTDSFVNDFVKAMDENDADFVMCNIASSRLADSEAPIEEKRIMNASDCRDWLSNPIAREYVIMVVAWNKMYKREIFANYRFEPGLIHEDEFMINNIIFDMNKAVFIPEKNYIYRINSESITGKENQGDIKHLHVIDAYDDRITKAVEHGEMEFANTTLKWALLKLAQHYKAGDVDMQKASMEMFDKLYKKHKHLLTSKQQMKYGLFDKMPKVFCKAFANI
ncbi:Glycosyltransferase involved in cell wall bisynthesis [Pseudobutyrivibrio sp. YE44]|uniref:glycosyltransferase n=1 Tax=Pseudobutyrivibrio sp. YE44 TaxID=1520802 RepID=UPI00088A3F41|nr:glycosyltransferase [Pseudobutyrivibrio sp. YE44]SDB46627.1 Glycosyltransferase involved in cell wall bisynthesis [Pseudobutyrivibrio sp. YE44]